MRLAPARRAPRAALALVVTLVTACGGGGDGGTPPTPPPPPPPTVSSVTVALPSATLFVGASARATATARDAAGAAIAGRSVTWASSDTTRATVGADGTVTGRAPGTAQITATVDGRSGGAPLTVALVPVASVAVTVQPTSIAVGATAQATAALRDSAGGTLGAAGRTIAWTVAPDGIATITQAGVVTGRAAGTATVTATAEGRSGQATLAVTAPVPAARSDTLFAFPVFWSPAEVTISVRGFLAIVFQQNIGHNAIFRLNPGDPPVPGAPNDIVNPIANGQIRTVRFTQPGRYKVNCTIHPGMIADVVVEP